MPCYHGDKVADESFGANCTLSVTAPWSWAAAGTNVMRNRAP